jgi:hypothetical protein
VFSLLQLSRLAAAFCLSAAALSGSVVVQGKLFFYEELRQAWAPRPVIIRRFSPDQTDQTALVIFMAYSARGLDSDVSHIAGLYDLQATPPVLRSFALRSSCWVSAGVSRGGDGFLSTENGDLFWLDTAAADGQPIYFGTHPTPHARWLETPDDGSLMVATGVDMTAWDHHAAKMLWHRPNLKTLACAFVPGSRRLICALQSAAVVELDPVTGKELRRIARFDDPPISLAISPDGQLFAVTNITGSCFVGDLASGRSLWSRRFFASDTDPKFSADRPAPL